MEETFNEQILAGRGRLKFSPESLPAFQTDDKTKMERYKILTDTGVPNSVAAKIVGMDLPEGMKPEDLDPEKPEPAPVPPTVVTQNPPQPTQGQNGNQPVKQPANPARAFSAAEIKDLKTWHDTSARWFKKGKGKAEDFECKALPDEISDGIREKLRAAETEEAIDKAFEVETSPETITPAPVYKSDDLMYLADALNHYAEKAEPQPIVIVNNQPTKRKSIYDAFARSAFTRSNK